MPDSSSRLAASGAQLPASSPRFPASSFQLPPLGRAVRRVVAAGMLPVLAVFAPAASAQTFEAAGARAAGMGGAFVAVADDASAVYWNPAGLASGSFFSVALDHNTARANREGDPQAGSQSATFLGLAFPALGITYYRLRATTVESVISPADQLDAPRSLDGVALSRVASLISHHAGVTLVQSLTDNVAVGTTLKVVRGIAAAGLASTPGDRDDLLDDAGDLVGSGSTKFDADIGVIAAIGILRAGLTLRNVREPEFDVPDESEALKLHRQVRAGLAVTAAPGVLVAADLDLRSVPGTTGLVRNFAAGAEGRVLGRALLRGGFHLNTRGDQPGGRAPVASVGGSYAVYGSLFLDGQASFGSDAADRGWGVGARMVF